MYIREYIDDMFVRRLNRQLPSDLPVSNCDFNEVRNRLELVMNNLAKKAKIPGFTEEDFMSFFNMKIHQLMRRGQLKPPNPTGYIVSSLKMLVMEINEVRKFYLMGESVNQQKIQEQIRELELKYNEKFRELTEVVSARSKLQDSLMSQDLLDVALPFKTLDGFQTIIKGDEENTSEINRYYPSGIHTKTGWGI